MDKVKVIRQKRKTEWIYSSWLKRLFGLDGKIVRDRMIFTMSDGSTQVVDLMDIDHRKKSKDYPLSFHQ